MVDNYDSDFSHLLSLVVDVVNARSGMPIAAGMEWQNDCHVLAKQLVLHLHTVRSVAAGTTIQVDGAFVPFIDHGSVKVLARAALENYIVLSFLFRPDDAQISRFRHSVWRFAGLNDRQRRVSITDEGREKLRVEQVDLSKLREEIELHAEFGKLTKAQRAALNKGDWSLGVPWHELAVEAGLHRRYFKNLYNYLCDYSHSSYAASLQVGQAVDIVDQRTLASSMLGALKMLMAHLIHLFADKVDLAKAVLDASQFNTLAARWHFSPDKFDSIYGD